MNEACSTHGPKESQLERRKRIPCARLNAQMGGHGLDPFGSEYEQTADSCEYGRALHIPQNARLLDKLCN
jgi:hypothetical protein